MSTTITAGTATNNGASISSDTAGTIQIQTGSTPTTAITIDGSQNVGIGVTPSAWASSWKVLESQGGFYGSNATTGNFVANNCYSNGTNWIYKNTGEATQYYQGGNTHIWYGAASGTAGNAITFSERMRIDSSGNLLVGTTPAAGNTARGVFARASATSYYDGQLSLIATNSSNVLLGLGTPDNGVCIRKENGVNSIDAVNSNQTAWTNFRASAFSVQSDYRVKENITPIDNALNRVSQLNPVRFNYAEGSMAYTDGKLVDGFIAHEVAEVVPEAVIGAKDEVKEDGTPLYQSLDQAKLIPIMVKAIQEQQAMIEELKTKVAALEAK